MPRLQIQLTEGTLAQLQKLARAERRAPRDQATVLIERSLRFDHKQLAPAVVGQEARDARSE